MDDWLNRTLAVWRETSTADAGGGSSTALAFSHNVAAKVDQPSAAEQLVAAQSGSKHSHNVYLAPGADVARGDELRGDGQVFTVQSVVEPSEPVYRKAAVELVQSQS